MNTFSSTTRRESFSNGLIVRVDEQGSGRPVLVFHGASGPQSVAGFAEGIAQQAHVLVPTHPGFAGEPRTDWFTDVDDLALTYLELLERLDLRKVIVVGFSFGGWIAAELALRATTRLSGLILVDAAGIQVADHEINMAPPRSSARDNQPSTASRIAPAPMSSEQAEERAANRQAMAIYGREGMYDPKLRRRLARVRMPALVVWGENDPIMDLDYGRAYAQSLPDARFAQIPEAGHFPQLEQPERLLTLVHAFLDSIPVLPVTEAFDAQ